MVGYLIERALEIAGEGGVRDAVAWAVPHGWFEATVAAAAERVEADRLVREVVASARCADCDRWWGGSAVGPGGCETCVKAERLLGLLPPQD